MASLNVVAAAGVPPVIVNVPPIPMRSATVATVTTANATPLYAAGSAPSVVTLSVIVSEPRESVGSAKSVVTLPWT